MQYKCKTIPGRGRGRFLGFPTINLQIPFGFDLEDGIYAVRVLIGKKSYIGAMHYGPIPVFQIQDKSLEIFIINAPENFQIDNPQLIQFEIKFKLREIQNFDTAKELSKQIAKDVIEIKKYFQE